MPSNLDLVRSLYAEWERGDFSSRAWAHPEFELVWSDGPSPGTWSGLAGVEAGWRDFLGAWDDYRVRAEDYLMADDERVLVLVRFTARGKTSGVEVGESGARGANLFHIRDGLVRRLVLYWDRDRALAELGIEEWVTSKQNAEIVREMYGLFNRGDIDAALRLLHPQPELYQAPEVVDAEAYVGLEAFLRGMILFMDEWEDVSLEPQDVDEVGDFVLMRVRVSGRGKSTGLEMTTQFFHAWAFCDGKPWRCFVRSTRDAALEAAELKDG